ncbi:MAG: type II toxin-antitoxin system RelE/ParE family toxin [Saprospiraceae bacterium]
MNKYRISFKKSTIKELYKLPNKEVARIIKSIGNLAIHPRPTGCKKLKGYMNLWRIKSGNYRIIYSIEDLILVVEILEIVDRKDAY